MRGHDRPCGTWLPQASTKSLCSLEPPSRGQVWRDPFPLAITLTSARGQPIASQESGYIAVSSISPTRKTHRINRDIRWYQHTTASPFSRFHGLPGTSFYSYRGVLRRQHHCACKIQPEQHETRMRPVLSDSQSQTCRGPKWYIARIPCNDVSHWFVRKRA